MAVLKGFLIILTVSLLVVNTIDKDDQPKERAIATLLLILYLIYLALT